MSSSEIKSKLGSHSCPRRFPTSLRTPEPETNRNNDTAGSSPDSLPPPYELLFRPDQPSTNAPQAGHSAPALSRAIDISCRHTWIPWEMLLQTVWRAIFLIEEDLEIWKWFKLALCNRSHHVEQRIMPQNFEICGGPRHTVAVYHRLELKVGFERMKELEFLVVLEFGSVLVVYSVWKTKDNEATMYGVLKLDIDKFAWFVADGFKGPYKGTEGHYYVWAWDKMLVNCEIRNYCLNSKKKPVHDAAKGNKSGHELRWVKCMNVVAGGPINKECHELTT
ncbi:hypothetical protein Cantr_08080 [Candida viswanathii]|uniref:Uncharacterized protein n=1 Tax=Candida viswanathii TaxID=5486 RepID=A0A367Y3V2_9ASCO|nr:hypothetical protein Cantr_08080 [Candida viswanathii]